MLLIAVCCLILGGIFKMTADKQQGTKMSTGVMIDGEFQSILSGRIGADQEKYEMFNTGGNAFFVFSAITGVIGVVFHMKSRKK